MEKVYSVIINNIDYSKYLSLPFTVNLRADEAYDTAMLTLIRTNKKEEFEPYTPVTIEISNQYSSKKIDMVVEEDSVEEIYAFEKQYYTHKLTLIERIKILDGVYVPSFSITNPATVTSIENFVGTTDRWSQVNSDYSGGGLNAWFGNDYDFEGDDQDESVLLNGYTVINGAYWHKGKQVFGGNGQYWSFIFDAWRSYYDVPGIYKDSTVFNGTFFEVPTPTTQVNPYACSVRIRYDYNVAWMGYGYGRNHYTTNYKKNQLTAYYYYDYSTYGNLSSGYDSRKIIVGYTLSDSSTGQIWGKKIIDSNRFKIENGKVYIKPLDNKICKVGCVVVKPGPWYDSIYSSLYGSTPSYDMLWNLYYNTNYKHFEENGGEFKLSTIGKWANDADGQGDATSIDNYCRRMADYALNSQYNWSNSNYSGPNSRHWDAEFNINVITVPEEDNPNIISAKSPYTTIGEVVDKVINMIDPSYGIFTANNIPEVFRGTEVPERVYNDQNVSEILFDLGKIIRAYPKLDSKNNISFDELTPLDNPLFEASTEGTTYNKNTDNAVTRFVSHVENVVSTPNTFTEVYSYWPSRTSFARPNGDPSHFTSNPDASTITVSSTDGIYYLKKIEVTNFIQSGGYTCENGKAIKSSTVLDITPFCYEKNYYSTLKVNSVETEGTNVANFSKDNCIWWEQKKPIIHLEELEQQTKVALFGNNAPDTYRIQNTIIAAVKSEFNENKFAKSNLNSNPIDYRYRITYIEYNSARTITEKFNDNKTIDIASNYNQTANTISGVDWSSLAQTDLLRRGSRDLSKNINIRDISLIPEIGESLSTNKGVYFADNINLTFDNSQIGCAMNYTKNYNKILPAVTISKEYRQYEIYGEAAVDRYVNINRYQYLDLAKDVDSGNIGDYNSNFQFANQLGIGTRSRTPSIAVALFLDKDKNLIKFKAMDGSGNLIDKSVQGIIIPLTYTTSGNSISFTAKMHDNFSGGSYANSDLDVPYRTILGETKASGAWVLEDARYVDDLGEAAYVNFYIIKPGNESSVYNNKIYPYTISNKNSLRNYSLEYEEDIRIDKDNRERICFNYQLHFLTQNENIKWHPALLKYMLYDNSNQDAMFYKDGNLNIDMIPKYYAYTFRLQDERFAPSTSYKSASITTNIFEEDSTTYSLINPAKISNIIDGKSIKSVALVWPKTNEILFHMDLDFNTTNSIIIPEVIIRPFKNKK